MNANYWIKNFEHDITIKNNMQICKKNGGCMKLLIALCLIAPIVAISGCATSSKYDVKVDSLSILNPLSNKDYILLPGSKDVKSTDLQFQSFATLVKRALSLREFKEVDNPDKASIAIYLEYGIGNPTEHNESSAIPMLGQTGVSSAMTTGTVTAYRNTASFSGVTSYTPTYGITGFIPVNNSYTTYFRYLLLNAFDLEAYRAKKQEVNLFKTTITSRGTSSDLRTIFPVMLGAGLDYLGTQTDNQLLIHMNDDDERIYRVKGLPVPPKEQPIAQQY